MLYLRKSEDTGAENKIYNNTIRHAVGYRKIYVGMCHFLRLPRKYWFLRNNISLKINYINIKRIQKEGLKSSERTIIIFNFLK